MLRREDKQATAVKIKHKIVVAVDGFSSLAYVSSRIGKQARAPRSAKN